MMTVNRREELEEEGFNVFKFSDLVHIFTLIGIRCIVLGVKYGFYSKEHMTIYRSIKIPYEFQMADMLRYTLNTHNVDSIKERMCIAMNQLGIESSSFVLEVKRNQPIYDSTLVNDYELLKQDYMNFVEQGKNYMPPTNKNC